ncbi:unnamed protein product [Blepharisma stoltei]|uniref:Sperm-tail PG-rich repeat-containing protein 2 n=1 Tax=Blepharisma stoltei TaxID=1481888 RepID=A0AAU9J3G6_9CILI|nr:unnamed protein product [Blepharisma stoltei]
MKLVMRKTEFWQAHTPAEVGPGTYEINTSKDFNKSAAPFSVSEKRTLSAPKTSVKFEPGPGTYSGREEWLKQNNQPICNFISKAPRIGPFAPGVTGFTLPTSINNPGPGTYELESNPKAQGEDFQRRRPQSLLIEPSPPSIPSKNIKKANIGPTSYSPDHSIVKPSSRGAGFGSYRGRRSVFEPTSDARPGPGEYSFDESIQSDKESWNFQSKTVRPVTSKSAKDDKPGPGSYEVASLDKKNKVQVEGFGITAKRDMPLTRDPHRPFVVGNHDVPPVGNYYSKEQLNKIEELKQKFVSFEMATVKPGFNTSEKREMPWVTTAGNPGPGEYASEETIIEEDPNNPFGSRAERFRKPKPNNNPGPGSYEPNSAKENDTSNSSFKSKTPRFKGIASDNLCVTVVGSVPKPVPYISHKPWAGKQSRAYDYQLLNPKISFDSSSNRFFRTAKDPNNPGPGSYDSRPKSVPTKQFRLTSARFSNFGSYRPGTGTNEEVGPGSYPLNSQIKKKSFNMAAELGREKPWII